MAAKAKKSNTAFMQPKELKPALEAIVGKGPMPRSEVVKALWVYIKKHDLQDAKNRRQINADEKLKVIFGGKDHVDMFQMTKHVSDYIIK